MNKLIIKMYQVLYFFVVISLILNMVSPAHALSTATPASNSTKSNTTLPYTPYLTNPYAFSDAPLPDTSIATMTETDPFAMLQMPNIPVLYTPTESNSPFGALNMLNDSAKETPSKVNTQAQIIAQAQAQSAKAQNISTETTSPTYVATETETATPTYIETETSSPTPTPTDTETSSPTTTPTETTTEISTETPTATLSSQKITSTSNNNQGSQQVINDPNCEKIPSKDQRTFMSACNRNQPALGQYKDGQHWSNSTDYIFENGALSYNANNNTVYFIDGSLYNAYKAKNGPDGFAGYITSNTIMDGAPMVYRDEFHDFRKQPYNATEKGFISYNDFWGGAEVHLIYPVIKRVVRKVEKIEDPTDNTKKILKNTFEFEFESLPSTYTDNYSGTVFVDAEWYLATKDNPDTPDIDESKRHKFSGYADYTNGDTTSTIESFYGDTQIPTNALISFYVSLFRSEPDFLIGYAPCLYFPKNELDWSKPYHDFTAATPNDFPVSCDGASQGDTTPPSIKFLEIVPFGGDLYVIAEVTDEGSGVASVVISGGPQNIVDVPMQSLGKNKYKYVFKDVPYLPISTFTVKATDNAGNVGTASGNSRMNFYANKGLIGCNDMCGNNFDATSGDPIIISDLNSVQSMGLMSLAGPGHSGINIFLTCNSKDSTINNFGQCWRYSYQYSINRFQYAFDGLLLTYPDGHTTMFLDNHDGTFSSPTPKNYDHLIQRGDHLVLINRTLDEFEFDATGNLVAIRDSNHNETRFLYTDGKLTRIENDANRGINLSYNADGMVSALDGPESKHVELGYTDKTLTSIKDVRSQTWTLEYERRYIGKLLDLYGQEVDVYDNLLTSIMTPKGFYKFKNQYNDKEEVIDQVIGNGREHHTYSRDEAARSVTVTDAYNKAIKYSYDDKWRLSRTDYPDSSFEEFGYDDNFNRIFWRDRTGKEWHYSYDDRGNRLTEDGPMGYHRAWKYHDTFNKPIRAEEKIADGKVSVWTFDYDDKGNLKAICNPYNCGSMTYNERGQPLAVIDFAGNVATNSYEADWDLASTSNGEGETSTFGTDGAGRIVRITSPLQKTYTFTFDPNDNVTDVNGPMGYHTSTSYDQNGNVETQTDANGGKTIYSFDSAEKPISIKNQNGVTIVSYVYGDMSEVKSFTDGAGRVWSYDNDINQRMIGMHGPLGVNITFQRDAVGNITDMTDAEGRINHTEYNDLYQPITMVKNVQKGKAAKDPDANITTQYQYDLVGNLLQTTDPEGNVTVFDFDLLNQIVNIRDAENQVTKFEYTELGSLKKLINPRGKVISFTYDKANRKLTFTNQLNVVTTYAYDDDGHLSDITDGSALHVVTHYTYNDLGRMSAEIRNYKQGAPQDSQTNVTTQYTYDLVGNLKIVKAPRGEVATYTYDPAFRLTDAVDFAGGHTKYDYDNVNNLLQVTDGNLHVTKYGVDALNRITSITNPELHTVKFSYNKTGTMTDLWDANGNHTQFTLDRLDRVKAMLDAMGGTWRYDYDKVGNILVQTDANTHSTRFTYDKVYRLLTNTDAESNITQFAWDENSNLKKLIDGNNHATDFGYDDADQPISRTNAENETTQYKYNELGYQSKLIEADNTVTGYGYDPLYRLNQVTENEKAGPSNNDTNVVTRYVYDKNSNLEQFINAKGAITKFEHDGMGRVTKETNPLNSVWQYKYDAVGNLSQRIDAKGKLTQYLYYPDDKPQQISYFDGTTVKFAYDKNNNLTSMQDKLGTSTWHYDALNRVKDVSDSLGRALAFDYDPVGNRLNMTYPDGKTVKYAYYDNNWMKSMTSPGGTTSYTPDHVGNITHISNPNSTETVISYDKVNRTKTLLNQQLTGAAKINSKFTYIYNKVGYVTNIVSTYASQGDVITNGRKVGWQKRTNVSETYGYDGLHRLNSAVRSGNIILDGKPSHLGWKMSYEYDKVGNRTKWTTDDNPFTNNPKDNFTTTYTYNAANQLTQTKVVAKQRPDNVTIDYSYDKNGNRINKLETPLTGVKRGTAYAYDPENRLVTAQDYQINGAAKRIDRAVTTLAYDGLGRRLAQTYDPKVAGGGAKRVEYTFDGLDPVVETQMWNPQYDNYYRGALGRISVRQHFPAGTEGQFMWYDYNFKGDVSGLSKQSGQSIHNYQYDPYGGVIPQNGNFTDPHNDYTLTGKEYDNNTGLIYFGARHYDPQSAQWMTQDSYRGETSQPATLSRYAYLISNPINFVDLYGFKTVIFVQGIDGNNFLSPDNGKDGGASYWDKTQIYSDAHDKGYSAYIFCYGGQSGYATSEDGQPVADCSGKPNTTPSKEAAAKLYREIAALHDPDIIIASHSKGSNVVKYMLSQCLMGDNIKEWYSYNGATANKFSVYNIDVAYNGNAVSIPFVGTFDPKKLHLEMNMTILEENNHITKNEIRTLEDAASPGGSSACDPTSHCYIRPKPESSSAVWNIKNYLGEAHNINDPQYKDTLVCQEKVGSLATSVSLANGSCTSGNISVPQPGPTPSRR